MLPAEVLSELLQSKEYSDLKIHCGGFTFDVHKSIVFTQAPKLKIFLFGEYCSV